MKAKLGQWLIGATVIALGILSLQESEVIKQGRVGQSAEAMEALILGQGTKPTLSLSLSAYSGERKWLYAMYHTAVGQQDVQRRESALAELVRTALASDDLNMALIAAQRVGSVNLRCHLLGLVVDQTLERGRQLEYAALAVTLIPNPASQKAAMDRLVDAYVAELYGSGGKLQGEKLVL